MHIWLCQKKIVPLQKVLSDNIYFVIQVESQHSISILFLLRNTIVAKIKRTYHNMI